MAIEDRILLFWLPFGDFFDGPHCQNTPVYHWYLYHLLYDLAEPLFPNLIHLMQHGKEIWGRAKSALQYTAALHRRVSDSTLNEWNRMARKLEYLPLSEGLLFWNVLCCFTAVSFSLAVTFSGWFNAGKPGCSPVPAAVLALCFVFTLLVWSLAVRAVAVIGVHHLFPFPAFHLQLQITLNSQTACGWLHTHTHTQKMKMWHPFSINSSKVQTADKGGEIYECSSGWMRGRIHLCLQLAWAEAWPSAWLGTGGHFGCGSGRLTGCCSHWQLQPSWHKKNWMWHRQYSCVHKTVYNKYTTFRSNQWQISHKPNICPLISDITLHRSLAVQN